VLAAPVNSEGDTPALWGTTTKLPAFGIDPVTPQRGRRRAGTNLMSLPRICRENAVALDLDFAMPSEHLQEHGDPLARRHDAGHQHAQAAHRARGDDDIAAWLRVSGHFQSLVVPHESSQIGDHRGVHFRGALTEVDDAGDAWESVDLAAALEVFKAGEEVAREKRLRRPKRPSRSHPPETDARGKDFEVEIALQELCDFVFLSRSGVEGVPGHLFGKSETLRNQKTETGSVMPALCPLDDGDKDGN
jgi:hypothetical protein